MKRLFIITIAFFLCNPMFAQVFRQANWGDSKNFTKENDTDLEWEDLGYNEGFEILAAQFYSNNVPYSTYYWFEEDSLVFIQLFVDFIYEDFNEYILDFESYSEYLQSVYGESYIDKNWRNELYKNDIEKHGLAIALGHYYLLEDWYPEEYTEDFTHVRHILYGEKKEIIHVVEYSSSDWIDYITPDFLLDGIGERLLDILDTLNY